MRTHWLIAACLGTLVLGVGGCTGMPPDAATTATAEPTPTSVTIVVEGRTVTLVPGENILPETYELAQDPAFMATVNWIEVDGYWDVIAKGVEGPLDIDGALPAEPTPTLWPGMADAWERHEDPFYGLNLDYPRGWYTTTIELERGRQVRTMDASVAEQATRWISLSVFDNPHEASLRVWLAESAPLLGARVLDEREDALSGVPVLVQTVIEDDACPDEECVLTWVWVPGGPRVWRWAAWPGDDPATLNLLARMMSGFRP